jgi:hypothetical protein
MTEALQVYEGAQNQSVSVVNFEDYVMTTEGVLKQVGVIQEIMKSVMHLDEHFGTIPGTKKPSLYKPGAEKLSLVFRLRPEYEIRRSELSNGHREYEVVCTLYHIPTGQSVGQGVGSATTMEGKYRFRGGEKESTGRKVPTEYWNLKKADKMKEATALIGGPGFSVGKFDEQWEICKHGEKMEHDNPADYYNTILKMAKKRAHVDAILTATAASDIFTQDVEDMPEVIPGAKAEATKETKAPLKQPEKKTEAKKEAPGPELQTVTVTVVSVAKNSGETNGKPWTLYSILADDQTTYKTFSDTYADIGNTAIGTGQKVKIIFAAGAKGNAINGMSIEE